MGLPFMLPWNDYGKAPSQGGSYAIKTNQEEASFQEASRQEEICTEKVGSKEEACGSKEEACGSKEDACGSKEEGCCQEVCE